MSRADHATVPLEQLIAGYASAATSFDCLSCCESVHRGHIYPVGSGLVEAELAMQHHVRQAHGSPFHALLALGKKGTGLTDIQRTLLRLMYDGLSDREIQPRLGGVSLSTIRNHRYALREKARQARVLVALSELLERSGRDPGQRFIEIPGTKAADDERFAITRDEFDRIVKAQFPDGPDGRMSAFPKKEKRKIAVMIHVLKRFDPSRRYTEKDVNEILASVTDDPSTLRRFLVDYGFLGRTRSGSEYWVEGHENV